MKLNYRKIFVLIFQNAPIKSILLILLVLGVSGIPALQLILLQKLVDSLSVLQYSRQAIIFICLYIIISYFLNQLFGLLLNIIKKLSANSLSLTLMDTILEKTTKLPLPIYEKSESNNLVQRVVSTQLNGIQSYYEVTVQVICYIISLIAVMISMKTVWTWLLFFLLILCAYPIIKIEAKLSKKMYEFNKSVDEEIRYYNELNQMLFDRSAAGELFSYGMRDKLSNRWLNLKKITDAKINNNSKNIMKQRIGVNVLRDLRVVLCIFAVLVLKNLNFMNGAIAISLIYGSFKMMSYIDYCLSSIIMLYNQSHIIKDFNKVMDYEEESGTELIDDQAFEIQFEHVYYKYPGTEQYVLEDVSFLIHKNEKVVFVGQNGSGKSTMVRLILGFDQPTKGNIYINGIPIKDVKLSLRKYISVMFQDFARFELTYKENITISNLESAENSTLYNDIIQWAEIQNIEQKLPEKGNTDMIEGGKLSGGEWQRIAFARAKFRKGKIVILDEPNVAVDALYEIKMYQDMMELSKEATLIVVSHRLPICQLCDKIIVMEHGKMIEMGSHKQLLEEKGTYFDMYKEQASLYA